MPVNRRHRHPHPQQVQALIEECADVAQELRDAEPAEVAVPTRSSAAARQPPREEPCKSHSKPKTREYRQMVIVRGGPRSELNHLPM